MGIMTDNLQMINRTLQDENSKKTTKKESKENYINFLFFEFWNNFAKAECKKDIYLYFKDSAITKKYIKLKYEDRGKGKDGYNNIIPFDGLTIPEKMEIYDNILNKVYNRFKIVEKEEEKEKQIQIKEEERKQKELEKLKIQYMKLLQENEQLQRKRKQIYKNGFKKIAVALFIGGRLASKENNKKRGWKN